MMHCYISLIQNRAYFAIVSIARSNSCTFVFFLRHLLLFYWARGYATTAFGVLI